MFILFSVKLFALVHTSLQVVCEAHCAHGRWYTVQISFIREKESVCMRAWQNECILMSLLAQWALIRWVAINNILLWLLLLSFRNFGEKNGCINYCADQLYTCWPSGRTGHIWSTCLQSFCCGLPFSVSIACVSTGYQSCWHPCEQTAWPSCWGGQSFPTCGQLKWWSFWKKTDGKCRQINHLQKDLAQAQNYLL